jgi:DNA uptake protein ComE-like DNA-binding protein
MRFNALTSTLVAAALLLCANMALAADSTAAAPHAAASKATGSDQAAARRKAIDAKRKAEAKIKLVDINSAGKKELKTLPGIGDAEAEKIIASRPFGGKAQLTTRGLIPGAVYENLKARVIARQKPAAAAKPAQK